MKNKPEKNNGPIYILKAGTSALQNYPFANRLSQEAFNNLARQLYNAQISEQHPRIPIVSSGAVQAGREIVVYRGSSFQALKPQLAGIGTYYLLEHWRQAFDKELFGQKFGMLWVTYANWLNEKERENIRANAMAYLENNITPLFNENDVVATDELHAWDKGISENDRLAVMVAELLDAKGVIFITSAGGVFSADPNIDKKALMYKTISPDDAEQMIKNNLGRSPTGSGGVNAKLRAALECHKQGRRVGIFGLSKNHCADLRDFIEGKPVGTTIGEKTSYI